MTKEQFKELEGRAKAGDAMAEYDLGVAYHPQRRAMRLQSII